MEQIDIPHPRTVENECNEHVVEDIKMDIQDSIINVIIKTEPTEQCDDNYMEDIKPSHCESCSEIYEWFCLNCSMLVHILDNTIYTQYTPQNTIPKRLLEIKHLSDDVGVFTKKTIPKGIIFGPFYGLNLMPLSSSNAWKFNGTKFVDIDIEYSNWMQYIKCVRDKSECNLMAFQFEDNLYYETNQVIKKGEELLWYCDEEDIKKLRNTTIYYEPVIKKEIPDIYACMHCCLGFSSSQFLQNHKVISPFAECKDLQEIVQCAFCKIYLDQREYMNYHMTYCCEKQSRKLLMAAELFNTKPKVRKKKNKKHKRDYLYKRYLCPKCAYSTKYLSNLFQHNLVHTQEKKFACKECPYRCNKKQNLQLHEKNKHSFTLEKKFKCPICPFQTNYQSSIKNHANVHEDIGPEQSTKLFNCTQCPFVTKYKANLMTHNLNHNLESKQLFSCKDCDYVCVTKQNFQLHVKKVHLLDVEMFKCAQCTYETIYKQNLKNHFIVHSNTKQYQCEKCEFSTKYKGSFAKHYRNRHDMKRFSCKICDYKHNKRSTLAAHVKKLHSDNILSVEDCIEDSVKMCQRTENAVEENDLPELIGCDFETLINPV